VNVIIKMVGATRIDATNWSVSLMRQAVSQAAWHVTERSAFGSHLIDKPPMQIVLADLELETEIGTLMVMWMSGAFERASIDEGEAGLSRMPSAVGKYWLTKRATPVVREALECRGGDGYVEESIMPRLYREASLKRHLGRCGQRHRSRFVAGPAAVARICRRVPRRTRPGCRGRRFTRSRSGLAQKRPRRRTH
jgi:alkylation response protein AidB-like acyl-CoA dehydrogenase